MNDWASPLDGFAPLLIPPESIGEFLMRRKKILDIGGEIGKLPS
jgi:hypothetical protein